MKLKISKSISKFQFKYYSINNNKIVSDNIIIKNL